MSQVISSNKPRRNKDHIHIKTYDMKTCVGDEIFEKLDAFGHFYNHNKRQYNKVGEYNSKTRKEYVQNAVFENENGIQNSMNYRFFQGIMQEVVGQHKSIQSNRENYHLDKMDRLSHVEKEIKKLSEKYYNLIKNQTIIKNHNFEKEKQSLLKVIRAKYKKRQYIKNAILNLEDKNNYKICYGSKQLMKKRHRIKNIGELKKWKEEWYRRRNGQFMIVGSWEECQGNSNCQMDYDKEKDSFSIQIRFPYELEAKYGKHIVLENLTVPHYFKHKLIHEIQKHRLKASNRNAISFRFIQLNQHEYRIMISLNHDNTDIMTHSSKGVIGVDVNADHLSVVEIAKNGGILHAFNIPMDLEDKSAHQRKDIIANAIKSLRLYALEKKKHIVVENLNFKQKRQQLHQSNNKKYNKILSAFSYQKIQEGLKLLEYEYGIKVEGVSPAYTSQLGKTVAAEKALTTHQAAAWFIAKRFYKLKESIKKLFKYKVKDALFIVLVPSRIQRSFKLLKHFIRDIEKYVHGSLSKRKTNEFKSIVLPYSKNNWLELKSQLRY